MERRISWGIIGTGNIAKVFAAGLGRSETAKLLAVGSRTQESADKFGDEFGIERRYAGYEAMLADPDVEAVYISTPHPAHAEWAIKAAEAGKHILCEKPIALDYAEASAIVEAARKNDVFLMEAFMYRCHPQTAKLVELIREGAIGKVRMVEASFGFHGGADLSSRLLNPNLGGGGIMDVGCYAASMARLVAGAAVGLPFQDPIDVKATGKIGDASGVDEYAAAILRFPGDIIAQISTAVQLNQENVARVFGTEGNIFIPCPWMCVREPGDSTLVVTRYGEAPREVIVHADKPLYVYEIDAVATRIADRQAEPPCMTWADTLGNMKTLDLWRRGVGMVYPTEGLRAGFPTVDRRRLVRRASAGMIYEQVENLDKPVARIVAGTATGAPVFPLPEASVVFDEYYASGGNAFDTAHIYGGTDAILGQWIKNRGVRESVVVIGKGAHTPWCNPHDLTKQLLETLEHMQTDYLDIYLMHRDNPDIPVGEFVDVLNEHRNAGRIRAFGGSNWTPARIDAANEYARSKGLAGFTAVSNNFSLARMVSPVWDGTISSSDTESKKWFLRTGIPLFAWSSLARGFFAAAEPVAPSPWYSEDNLQRLARARELAAKRGVLPVQIALAYVLNQPFKPYALIGPASIDELRISLGALDIALTPEELGWLNLEA